MNLIIQLSHSSLPLMQALVEKLELTLIQKVLSIKYFGECVVYTSKKEKIKLLYSVLQIIVWQEDKLLVNAYIIRHENGAINHR